MTPACTHPPERRWFYRARFGSTRDAATGPRTLVEFIERCQECTADVRNGARVPLVEIKAWSEKNNMLLGLLGDDPWAPKSTETKSARSRR